MNRSGLLVTGCLVFLPALVAPGDSLAGQEIQVLVHELPGGQRVRVTERLSKEQPRFIHRRLAARSEDGPRVQRQSSDQWITSYWRKDQWVTVLIKPFGAGSRILTTYVSPRRTLNHLPAVPGWWPALQHPWSASSRDGPIHNRTMIGWLSQPPEKVRDRLVRAARQGGLELIRADKEAMSSEGYHDGRWLWFTGAGKEMMITLSGQPFRTGVVAHLREVVQ